MSVPAVRVFALEVRAGGRTILGPIDLEVAPGEHVLLVGRSGSGKTTLLRAIAGLAKPTAGRVELFGELVQSGPRAIVPPARRGIGFLFQGGALWPHMSVRKTLDFVLAHRGVPRAERPERIRALLETVELVGFDDRKPGTLSGGEAQRLALARALAGEPRLLLLDEPLGPLDAELRASMLAALDAIQRRLDLTVLHVTHDPGEASETSTRILRLEGGLLVTETATPPRVEAGR